MGGRAGGGGGRRGGGFGGKTERGLTTQEARTLLMEEAGIRGQNHETGIIVDANGNIVYKQQGQAKSVLLPTRLLKDNMVTHNHPAIGSDVTGKPLTNQSFSKADVVTAIGGNTKGLRIVTYGGYHYQMSRPSGGWKNMSEASIKGAFTKSQNKVVKSLQSYIANYKGDKTVATRRAQQIASHLVNKDLAKSLGYSYTKSKIK